MGLAQDHDLWPRAEEPHDHKCDMCYANPIADAMDFDMNTAINHATLNKLSHNSPLSQFERGVFLFEQKL